MAYVTLIQSNFASGEISPKLEGRPDLPRYQTGLRACEGFIPMRQGGLRKCPGSRYQARTKSDLQARLVQFVAADGTNYALEFTATNVRIYTTAGAQYGSDIATPYALADLASLKWACNKGSLWIAHPSYAVRRLDFSGGTFSLATPTFTGSRTFGGAGEYPRIVFFHQGRLGLGGATNRPNEICLSRAPDSSAGTDRYTDFTVGTSPADAIIVQKNDPGAARLRWALGQRRLILASDRIIAMDNGQLATPSTFDFQTCARSRPLDLQGALADNLVLYIGSGPSLHGLAFSTEQGGFQDMDLTRDSDHVLLPGVIDLAVQQSPEPIAWIVRSDGKLVSVSLDGAAGVLAPARHDLGGTVETACVLESDAGDTLWIVVNRSSRRSIETIALADLTSLAIEDEHYVHGGIVYSGASTTTITGLGHLEGLEVAILGDGIIQAPKTVVSGSITLDKAVTAAHVGLAINSKIETLRAEIPAQGTSQGKKRRIEELTLRLYRSLGGRVAAAGKESSPILYITAGDYKYGSPIDLYTGDKKKTIAGGLDPDTTLVITHSEPTPCTILALIYRVALMEA